MKKVELIMGMAMPREQPDILKSLSDVEDPRHIEGSGGQLVMKPVLIQHAQSLQEDSAGEERP